jgi:hypothetical protein
VERRLSFLLRPIPALIVVMVMMMIMIMLKVISIPAMTGVMYMRSIILSHILSSLSFSLTVDQCIPEERSMAEMLRKSNKHKSLTVDHATAHTLSTSITGRSSRKLNRGKPVQRWGW